MYRANGRLESLNRAPDGLSVTVAIVVLSVRGMRWYRGWWNLVSRLCCYNNTSAGPHRSPASNRLSDSDEVYSVVVQPWHSPLFETKSIHPLKAWFLSNAVATRTDFLVRDVVRRRRAFRGLKTSSEKIGRVVRRVRKLGRGSRCV